MTTVSEFSFLCVPQATDQMASSWARMENVSTVMYPRGWIKIYHTHKSHLKNLNATSKLGVLNKMELNLVPAILRQIYLSASCFTNSLLLQLRSCM